ncbi:MAG: hypothetical protein KJ792_04510 [Actinobacteria bacterium]|nr:hypothetical protein [Actinomycetota bacterium]MCG2801740.1 hypothetical protein [Cellulomonas sp.]
MTSRRTTSGRAGAVAWVLVAALLAVGVLLAGGAVDASAASLTVRARSTGVVMLARCQGSTVAVTAAPALAGGSVTALTLTGLDATACAGRPLRVEVVDPTSTGPWSSAVRASGTGTITATSATVTTAPFVPTAALRARVVIDGWTVPSSWTVTTAVGLRCVDASGWGHTCRVVVDRYQVWNGGYRLDFHVVTTSPLPFRYEIAADLSATGFDVDGSEDAFPGWPVPASPGHPSWYPAGMSVTNACVASSSADLPVIRLRGSGTGWNDYVASWAPAYSLGFQVDDAARFPTWAGCSY